MLSIALLSRARRVQGETAMGQLWCWGVLVAVVAVSGGELAHDVSSRVRSNEQSEGGGCSARHLCCQGKNNTCRVDGPRVSNSDSFTCFCDASCPELGDCCLDYKRTCQRQSLLHRKNISISTDNIRIFFTVCWLYSCVSYIPSPGAVVTVVSSAPTTYVPTQLNDREFSKKNGRLD